VTGFGVLEMEGSRLRFLEAGVLRAPATAPMEQRLARLSVGLREVLARHQPHEVAVEDIFVKVDPKAALAVGHGRGALLAVVGEAGLPATSYPPATIKKALTGSGRAAKDRVARMVAAVLGLGQVPEPLDATDALAVAITHALAVNGKRALGR